MNGEHGKLYDAIIKMGDTLSKKIDHLGERVSDKQDKLDCRIDKLEQFRSRVVGMVIVLTFVGGLIWRFVFS